MSETLVIRAASVADAEAISALVTPLARYLRDPDTGTQAHAFNATLTPESFAERLADTEFTHFVAEDAGSLVGMIAMRDGSHLHHLFVSRTALRRGIARQLWVQALRQFGRREYTVNSSVIAVPVYEKFGFVAKLPPQTVKGVRFVPMVRPRMVNKITGDGVAAPTDT